MLPQRREKVTPGQGCDLIHGSTGRIGANSNIAPQVILLKVDGWLDFGWWMPPKREHCLDEEEDENCATGSDVLFVEFFSVGGYMKLRRADLALRPVQVPKHALPILFERQCRQWSFSRSGQASLKRFLYIGSTHFAQETLTPDLWVLLYSVVRSFRTTAHASYLCCNLEGSMIARTVTHVHGIFLSIFLARTVNWCGQLSRDGAKASRLHLDVVQLHWFNKPVVYWRYLQLTGK